MAKALKAPAHLSEAARRWWRQLQQEYAIDDPAGLLLLKTAMEAYDRLVEYRQIIDRDGPVVEDRFAQKKPHPLIPAERDARAQLMMALKHLNLDLEPLRDRPGGR